MKKATRLILLVGLFITGCNNITDSSSSSFSSTPKRTSQPIEVMNYYSGVDFSSVGETLMNFLHSKIKNHRTLNYKSLASYYRDTDTDSSGKIIDMYSNQNYYPNDNGFSASSEGRGWNKEHSIPKSWFDGASPMESDIFHIYPTDIYVNSKRSNYAYGRVASATFTSSNGCKLGKSYGGGPTTVFEPADEYKGDFARTYFYFATCYMDKKIAEKGDSTFVFSSKKSYPKLTSYSIDLFLKWHRDDPVSQKEINRNKACYSVQNNRNPFIDFPEFAEQIWGSLYGQDF